MSDTSIVIPDSLFEIASSAQFEGSFVVGSLSLGADVYEFPEPVSWQATISNTGESLAVLGRVTGEGTCACARCLEPITFDFEGDIEGYAFLQEPTEEELEGFEVDEYVVLAEDEKILDMEPLIRAALCLDAPLVPLCKDDCAGLCPTCGANLNEGPCDCVADPDEEAAFSKNPFAVLKDLQLDD
ncbi:MAG: DUF177 domain-containing protein [Eggerthellales bacterium]|nr:DUF177 domain-containing protein [Eggerthellales bacterium]